MDWHSPDATIEFGRFTVLSHRRELLCDRQPVALGIRAFDLLVALIEAQGEVLSNEDLINRVWPGTTVDDNALQIQISALRKALSADHGLVRTIAGRGYQFTGTLRAPGSNTMVRKAATNL